jgi:hypothetical protein
MHAFHLTFGGMKRVVGTLWLVVIVMCSQAQIHVSKLVIKANEKFSFDQSDIVVADTLIMEDSSSIVLNRLKKENYLHTKVAIIGKGCVIEGFGVHGKPGRKGMAGDSPGGPCRSGTNGRNGGRGLDGTTGVNLFLYLEKITLNENLTVNLSGGNGGNGGNGGEGGGGSPGTVHCNGGDGGLGGNGGNGANGGNGGQLTIYCPANLSATVNAKINSHNHGGEFGKGGRGGYSGSAGLGPRQKKRETRISRNRWHRWCSWKKWKC